MSILTRFQKSCETKDHHVDPQLVTHYYKGTFRQVFDIVENMVREVERYDLEHVSKEHGELSLKLRGGKSSSFIITIIAVKPLEIAVDLHISTEAFSLLGTYPRLKNEVISFYQNLDKRAMRIQTIK
jgi:hypothetical protein